MQSMGTYLQRWTTAALSAPGSSGRGRRSRAAPAACHIAASIRAVWRVPPAGVSEIRCMCWGAGSMLQHPVAFWVASSEVVLMGLITAEGQVRAAFSRAVAIMLHTSSQPCNYFKGR